MSVDLPETLQFRRRIEARRASGHEWEAGGGSCIACYLS